ncbi:MAG TPA: maleylpyruvate isomerase N-terminal domain-containing protein [Streptomyces sp.]
MEKTLEFRDLLRLIDERSTAFCAAVAAAPSLDARVPTCPEWTLLDLVRHLGVGRQAWAATVAAGPTATAKAAPAGPEAPQEREALLEWMAASTRSMLDALEEAGPDQGCWTWWGTSQSPRTCGAVARHQLQEIAMHTYDAQLTAGDPRPPAEEVALDGVDEFLSTCVATTEAWPHEPAIVDYHVTEGRSWRLRFSADGAQVTRLPLPGAAAGEVLEAADVSTTSTAAELLLACYGRISVDALKVEGDIVVLHRLVAWEPG